MKALITPWGGLLAVTKLASRKVHGHQRKILSLSLTSKNMVLEIGDQCLLILGCQGAAKVAGLDGLITSGQESREETSLPMRKE